jgi:TP901 family phage tail tape measure protein
LLGLRTAVGSAAVIGLSALALGAIAAGKALRATVALTAEFEAQLNTFQAVVGATAEEMNAVSEAAQRLGADVTLPAVSAADAATAMLELAKAGLSVEESIAGVAGVLQLATAAQISNAEAALITANALNSFGLAGDQAVTVADSLANAANAAQGSIADFGMALAQSSAVARQVGLSLNDTVAILSLFAKNGLQGSDAGTSLRVALIKLAAPTDAAAAKIKELGLRIRDAQGNFRPDVFAQFGEATESLSPAMRDAAAALIFGQDAIRAVSIGAREGVDGLRLMQFQIDQQGTAAEVAATRTKGLAGAFQALQSSSESLGITIGKNISNPLQELVETGTNTVVILDTLIQKIAEFNEEGSRIRDSIPGGSEATDAFKEFAIPGKALNDFVLGPLARLATGSDLAEKRIADLNEQLSLLQEARLEAERGGQRGLADQLTREIEGLKDEISALKAAGEGIDTSITAPLQKSLDALRQARDLSISLDIDTGPIDRLIASLEKTIPITQKVEGNIQRLRDDFLNLGNAGETGASGVTALTEALNDLGRQAARAQDELLRLQTEGGTPQQQIAVLGGLRQTQEEIIARIKEDGNQAGDASAIRAARNKIKSFDSQIESLQNEIAADAKALASASEKAQRERQDAFERVLAAQLRPAERLLTRASATEAVGDDVKFREIIIGILRRQIIQIRKTLGNTEEARKLITEIQDRILVEVNKLKQDQRDFRRQLREALEERLERAQRGTELDIELADINENTKRRIALRRRLIAQLRKEARELKLTGNALKENRNEIARIQAEIDEINKAEKDAGKSARQSAAEFFFEQLQAQQGFAANLLGNLIPRDQTAGLVGGPAPPTERPERGIATAQAVVDGRQATGPTAGLQNTTNDLLQRILQQLRILNGSYDAPEAIHQKKVGSGSMDYAVM